MAQHIDIKKMPQKIFRKIEISLTKEILRIHPQFSLKYEYTPENSKFYAESNNESVAHTDRYIGKGFIYNSDRACFEVHFNNTTRNINKIYLVA